VGNPAVADELFVDTSAWFALADPKQRSHRMALHALRDAVERGRRMVTTNLVVAETHALLLRRVHRDAALTFVHEMRREPQVVVASTLDLELRAQVDWLERFHDQDFSFADAVSFAVMTERGIRSALTLDRHFAIAGFEVFPSAG
jgi:uncharacterized protein